MSSPYRQVEIDRSGDIGFDDARKLIRKASLFTYGQRVAAAPCRQAAGSNGG